MQRVCVYVGKKDENGSFSGWIVFHISPQSIWVWCLSVSGSVWLSDFRCRCRVFTLVSGSQCLVFWQRLQAWSDPYAWLSTVQVGQFVWALWCFPLIYFGFRTFGQVMMTLEVWCWEDESCGSLCKNVILGKYKKTTSKQHGLWEQHGGNCFACLDSQVEQNNIWSDVHFQLFIHILHEHNRRRHIHSVSALGSDVSASETLKFFC